MFVAGNLIDSQFGNVPVDGNADTVYLNAETLDQRANIRAFVVNDVS